MNMKAGRKGLLVLLTCFFGLLPSCSFGVKDASAQPFSGWEANSSAQHGFHAALTAAMKYLDASSSLSGRIISAYMYSPQLNASIAAGASNGSCGSSGQTQQAPSSKRLGRLIGGSSGASSLSDSSSSSSSSSSSNMWQALLAGMLVQQQQQPATGPVSQRRYLQQLGGLQEHSSRIAGLLMLDSSAWAKAPAWELLQLHAPAAMLTVQRLSDAFGTQLSAASGAAVTVVSALIASRLLLEML